MTPTPQQWTAYRLCVQEGKSHEEAAEEMGVLFWEVRGALRAMQFLLPDLFTDISSDGRQFDYGVSQFGKWCGGNVKRTF